ncbi:MAG: DUF4184 family protein [Chitinophagales bacterium]|nr:DUF4184 family protein [Chitinophagales bacterium]MCZ2394159.1 DUF4184 family protein [Chitinophagales bacterium]
MPHTLVHPGFVLPLYRWLPRYFNLPALIIGSWVPDLDIIYRFSETRYHLFTYTKTNILFTLIPIGVLITYFLLWVWIPLANEGVVSWRIKEKISSLKLLPKMIWSIGLAIAVHLLLDQFSHLNDAEGLGLRVGLDLGYESNEMQNIFILFNYLPQIISSAIGLILTLIFIWNLRKHWLDSTQFLRKHYAYAIVLFFLISISFATMKVIKSGIEQHKTFDSIAIGVTCGLMSGFFLLPLVLNLFLRLKNTKHIVLRLIPILSLYMLGLIYKEYLAIYIVKMFFISVLVFNFSFVVKKDNAALHIIFILIMDVIMTFFHPFSSYFTPLLFFKNLLLILLFILRRLNSTLYYSLLKGMAYGCLAITAYYASNKGSGWGILLLMIGAVAFEIAFYTQLQKIQSLLLLISKSIIVLIIFSVHAKLGILASGILILISILEWSQKSNLRKEFNWIFYIGIMPIIAVIYIGCFFSKAYGLFSLGIILLLLCMLVVEKGTIFQKHSISGTLESKN